MTFSPKYPASIPLSQIQRPTTPFYKQNASIFDDNEEETNLITQLFNNDESTNKEKNEEKGSLSFSNSMKSSVNSIAEQNTEKRDSQLFSNYMKSSSTNPLTEHKPENKAENKAENKPMSLDEEFKTNLKKRFSEENNRQNRYNRNDFMTNFMKKEKKTPIYKKIQFLNDNYQMEIFNLIEQFKLFIASKIMVGDLVEPDDFKKSIETLALTINKYNEQIEKWYDNVYHSDILKLQEELNKSVNKYIAYSKTDFLSFN